MASFLVTGLTDLFRSQAESTLIDPGPVRPTTNPA